ncbi:hypothetical protein K461DRAFT_313255 [Myriangium duriaei CBS 260.36]|uniref:Phosphatidate phosphatase APP1 catalytic domain-containing protein n=1 Tax=Myriangium duriaei CBS 260.36 TaxID=1168546 RepID=A0A9P4MJZ2_9PEZI|nr:hypothetical protein K461DRAFT_313255 [Myriangium duriaei CBS 260.36]
MRHTLGCYAALLSLAVNLSNAAPAPTPRIAPELEPREPAITPSPVTVDVTRTYEYRRNIISDLDGDLHSILAGLGSDIPSWVASGVPNFFQGFPTGDSVASSLGIQSSELAALPTQVLNVDPYANWTDQGWNVRFHGNVYKQPNTSTEKLNDLANVFLIGTDIQDLPADQQDQARNLTAEIFVVQQGNVNVSQITLEPAQSQGSSGDPTGGGGSPATGGSQQVQLPYNTTDEGDFDAFVPIKSNGLKNGNETSTIQKLNTYVQGASLGNSTAYLVPTQGLTIVSDIDDILRVTKIYEPKEGLLNSFARAFTPWENMPDIYAKWASTVPNMHFHYLTTTPEQITRNYMQFIYATYPGGSFDTRPLNFSDVDATLSIRKFLLQKIFQTFPERKFILIADTSNSDVMKDYPEMYFDFPNQVQCIFLRNTTATDSGDKFPYDTSGFKSIPQKNYMFFLNADDLSGLDIANGQCYNQSIAQNLTFGYQGIPGQHAATVNGSANNQTGAAAMISADSVTVKMMLASCLAIGALFSML